MAKYRVETDRGVYEVEADTEPTQEDVLAAIEAQETPAEPEKKFEADPLFPFMAKGLPRGTMIDLTLEAGLPAAGQALATPTSPLGQAVVGGTLSVLGNMLAQTRRIMAGEQKDVSIGQIGQSAALGAIPFAGPLKKAEGAFQAAKQIAGTAAKAGVLSAAGEQLRVGIDEGRLLTKEEATTAGLAGGVLGSGLDFAGQIGKRLTSGAERIDESIGAYRPVGAEPTPGMMFPENLARTEKELVGLAPAGKQAQAVDEVYNALDEGLVKIAPSPQEGAEIFKEVRPLLRQVSTAEQELAKLDANALKANHAASEAFQRLQESRVKISQEEFQEAQKLSDAAFEENLRSTIQNARDLAVARTTMGLEPVDPATARTLIVDHVVKPLEGAIDKRAAQMYAGVDNLTAAFDVAPIKSRAKEIAQQVTGQTIPVKLQAALSSIDENLGEGRASLQQLRNVRDDLLRRVKLQAFETTSEQRLITELVHEITAQIESQATKALGPEMGAQLKAANKFYRETRELFALPGVESLFSKNPADEVVGRVVQGIEKSGVNSDEYKNVRSLISKVAEFDRSLASSLKGHFNETIRGAVLHDAATINSLTGEVVVDGAKLADKLEKMARSPGTLEAIGFGTPKRAAELKTLFAKYPDAPAMKEADWNALFSSRAFQQASGASLAQEIEPVLAAASANARLQKAAFLKSAGKDQEAQRLYVDALRDLNRVEGDLDAAKRRYSDLTRDPVANAFNNPKLGTADFNNFARSLFETKASKVTNQDVTDIVTALRDSPKAEHKDLLRRLQERYIADKIASFRELSGSPGRVQSISAQKMDAFFNPANPADAANEIERARVLLEPGQIKQLEQFADAAGELARYEKLARTQTESVSREIGAAPRPGRIIDAIVDAWNRSEYGIAAWFLANPERAAKSAKLLGAIGEQAIAVPSQTAAMQAIAVKQPTEPDEPEKD